MKVYSRDFGAEFECVAPAIKWIESHLGAYSPLQIDVITLAVCECLHNILEHHIKRINKNKIFATESSKSNFVLYSSKSKTIHYRLCIKPTHIFVTLTYPFKPCYKFIKTSYKFLGGRGIRIIKHCCANIHSKVDYKKTTGVLTLRISLAHI